MTLYPDGYGTSMVTLDEMKRRHGPKQHPEFARRFFAYIEHKGGTLGVGGGWRSTSTISAASAAGKSFHQDQRFASGIIRYAAVDLVTTDGPDANNSHDGVTWAMTADAPQWGLHTFIKVPDEPWHIQCIEMRGFDSWVTQGRRDPPLFVLPTDRPPPPGDDMRPIITTWSGEPWTILVGFDAVASTYTWRGIPGDQVATLIANGAATDGTATPWPAEWKSQPWMLRLG